MGEKKKFEINVNANEENCKTGDAAIDEVTSMPKKVEIDVEEAETTKAEEILGDISMADNNEPIEEEPEKVEAEIVENSNKDESTDFVREVAGEAASFLNSIKDYIQGDKFDAKCEAAAKQTGTKKEIVKNTFIKNVLRGIADTLGLVVTVTGNFVIGAVNFIESIITSIVNFSVSSLLKLIQVATLNCGSN